MARTNFFQLFSIFLERFCDFGLSISTEYHSFLSYRSVSTISHRIGEMVLSNHRTSTQDYSITYMFSSSTTYPMISFLLKGMILVRIEATRHNAPNRRFQQIGIQECFRKNPAVRAEVETWSV